MPRRRVRQHSTPHTAETFPPLLYVRECQRALREAVAERDRAMLAAANAGATMREIGDAAGLSYSTCWRYVVRAESAGEETP